ncbi:hypothetical protein [Phytohalomonas tamaricis]|uniref:hypothetical protein n=1 Tax=Phytohalomonas tamaricis TaxID=2081032 RepID=UPI000D0AF1DD|nr:hypothetical protein [Phytohalomonas tamaricis]
MLDMTCHRCGSYRLSVPAEAKEWDEVTCMDCGEFIATYDAALLGNQPLPLVDACIKTQQMAQSMGISLQ